MYYQTAVQTQFFERGESVLPRSKGKKLNLGISPCNDQLGYDGARYLQSKDKLKEQTAEYRKSIKLGVEKGQNVAIKKYKKIQESKKNSASGNGAIKRIKKKIENDQTFSYLDIQRLSILAGKNELHQSLTSEQIAKIPEKIEKLNLDPAKCVEYNINTQTAKFIFCNGERPRAPQSQTLEAKTNFKNLLHEIENPNTRITRSKTKTFGLSNNSKAIKKEVHSR